MGEDLVHHVTFIESVLGARTRCELMRVLRSSSSNRSRRVIYRPDPQLLRIPQPPRRTPRLQSLNEPRLVDNSWDGGATPTARAIAFYLPQFHPIPENDAWWGPGFTEWTNVARARPLFPGHYQPRLPGELGFYDLRVAETRQAQADIARVHGVHAFCYWHYWFGQDRTVLERPLREVVESGEPDFPFCLGWANEAWRAIWGGGNADDDRVLFDQTYSLDDDARHMESLLPVFSDPRYVRVHGRPLFFVYRPAQLPDIARFVERWRGLAESGGLPGLYLVGMYDGTWEPAGSGFDAIAPWKLLPPFANRLRFDSRARHRPDWLASALTLRLRPFVPAVYSYTRWSPYFPYLEQSWLSFPVLMPGWDNSPRRGRSSQVFHRATPEAWGAQVRRALALVAERDWEERIVFVRSWNEWAEGNYLEPDRRFGRAFLKEFAAAMHSPFNAFPTI
jgi:hypothetical protein